MASPDAGRGGVTVGALGHPGRAVVDRWGRVALLDAAWSLDWWVHVGGRWHLPGRGATVRQGLIGHAPVVETCVRTAAGEIASVTYAVPGGLAVPSGLAVVDLDNRTAVPIAVALVVSRSTSHEPGAIAAIDWDGAGAVQIDGRVAMMFSRSPARAVAGPWDEGGGCEWLDVDGPWQPVSRPDHPARAAFVFPLARAGSLRAVLALGRGSDDLARHAPLPDGPGAVVRGWDRMVGGGLTVALPSTRLGSAVEAFRRRLLLAQDGAPDDAVAATAARWGLASPAGRLPDGTGPRPAAGAADGGNPDELSVTAALLDAVRDLVLREDDRGLALCPVWPRQWGRTGIDVHRAPTAFGLLSFAVRWHGDRPALLWEIDGPEIAGRAILLTAPGLDPAWSGSGARGEALLAAPSWPAAPEADAASASIS